MSDVYFGKVTVSGTSVRSIVHAVQAFSVLANDILDCLAVPSPPSGGPRAVDPDAWYAIDDYLRAYQRIETLLGGRGLEKVGTIIPSMAQLPPAVDSVVSALASLDVAFHMNHRRDGIPMFDPRDGTMLEGIGHYRAVATDGANEVRVVCENQYPCRFDLGLILGMARRFAPDVVVEHAEGGCRRRGGATCTYLVRW